MSNQKIHLKSKARYKNLNLDKMPKTSNNIMSKKVF